MANGDIAIVHVNSRLSSDDTASHTYPGDWAKVASRYESPACNHTWAWKRLDGTETGTINITGMPGGGVASAARIYVFRGCVASGTPYEAATQTGADSATVASSAITTLGTDRLAVCLVAVSDDNALDALTGSNVTWAESVAEFAYIDGLDGAIGCQQANVASITSITAGTDGMGATDEWATFTFALIPSAAAPSYQPRHGAVNLGLGNAANF